MGKLRKIITSRFFITGFIIFLQFTQLLAVFIIINQYSTFVMILSYIFSCCVILYVINKEEIPEFKMPWLIIILLLPIVGALIFILLNNNQHVKNLKKVFEKTSAELLAYSRQVPAITWPADEFPLYNKDAYLQANYIYNATNMPCYANSNVKYYDTGEGFYSALCEELNKAEHFIFLEYFTIAKGFMWDSVYEILSMKVKQGVKVNIIYDDLDCMKSLPQDYYKELSSEGIECIPFNQIRAVLSQIHNNRNHRKITVIDGKVGFTGGVNIADEYINVRERFGHWKDSAVKVEGEAVKNLTMLFLSSWNMYSKTPLEYEPYLTVQPEKYTGCGVVVPYGDGPGAFYPDNIGRNVYLNMINSAKEYLYITTPYLICDYAIMDALKTAAKKGVDVRIITPRIPDYKLVFTMTRSNYEPLIRDGVKIYEYVPGYMHAKNFISDDMFAVCGTINLDYRSLIHHYECGVWMYNTNAVFDMRDDFLNTIELSELITAEKAKLSNSQKIVRNIIKVFSPLL